ncbi:MAG: hypothetical protein AAB316_19905, partial [Bacteroidota bacterium]
ALFTNCQNNPSANADKTAADTVAADVKIEGVWVNKAWWETLESTKSPRKAAEKLGIAGVTIQQDSTGKWLGVVNYAFHEGGEYELKPVEGGNFQLLETEGKTKQHDLTVLSDSTLRIDSFDLVRFGDLQMDDTDFTAGIVSGTYSLKGKPGDVIFYSNGSVSGLEGYESYDVVLDYVVDEVGADEIMLIKPGDERDFYAFVIKGNQLLLSMVD